MYNFNNYNNINVLLSNERLISKEKIMVYGVFGGCYSDWYIVGYFDNRDDAEKYCCISNADYYVEPLKNLTNEKDLSKVELKYTHEVLFDYDKNNKYTMRKEPDRYRYYIDNELHCNIITKSDRRYNWIKFEINISHNDRELAEKIAQDYLAELRSYGDGKIYDENIKLMNEKFARPFKEKERLEKEKQLREKELAELQRLKDKYEN